MPDWFQTVLNHARAEAVKLQHPYIRSEHLLLALLKIEASALPISYDALHAALSQLAKPACGAEKKLTLAKSSERVVKQANTIGNSLTPQQFAEMIISGSPMLQGILNALSEEA